MAASVDCSTRSGMVSQQRGQSKGATLFQLHLMAPSRKSGHLNFASIELTTLSAVEHVHSQLPVSLVIFRVLTDTCLIRNGIRWIPKHEGGPPSPHPPGPPGGKVFIEVVPASDNPVKRGCLISTGKWLVGATCAGEAAQHNG